LVAPPELMCYHRLIGAHKSEVNELLKRETQLKSKIDELATIAADLKRRDDLRSSMESK